ncbi:hypothetical protein ACFCWG_29215 [Streptomyces sp. NPDC056390]|uniref:hypothetical protein n=1 Tax=Streptomyces sp. NPDC056390 TaxID=3345806 RepID=UPI0035D5C853
MDSVLLLVLLAAAVGQGVGHDRGLFVLEARRRASAARGMAASRSRFFGVGNHAHTCARLILGPELRFEQDIVPAVG